MELREVERDVYACLQEDRGLGFSNSGLVARGGGLVVDTFWDLRHTRELIESYARVWKAPARHVVNTHHNGDHCWGNQLFSQAEIIGHRLCAEAMLEEAPQLMQAVRSASSSPDPVVAALAGRLAEWDFSGIELTPPTTLIEDRLSSPETSFSGAARRSAGREPMRPGSRRSITSPGSSPASSSRDTVRCAGSRVRAR